jgi:hypothetical protein
MSAQKCAAGKSYYCEPFAFIPGLCKHCGGVIALSGDRDGATFDADRDRVRLDGQMLRVYEALADGAWHTPAALEERTGDNWASISARCRDLRKSRFGGYTVERRSLGGGVFSYRLLQPHEVSA